MSGYSEEHIFKYLDGKLSADQTTQLELAMKNDPELNEAVDQLRAAHQYFQESKLETAPERLPEHVMTKVKNLSKQPYYSPSGLFSNTGFLLISGVLTALVALLSILQGGYVDVQSMSPGINELGFLQEWSLDGILTKKVVSSTMLVIYGVLALALLDRFVLNPYFRKKPRKLGFN